MVGAVGNVASERAKTISRGGLGSAPWRSAVVVAVVYLLVWTGLDWVAAQYTVAQGVSLWYAPAAVNVVLLLVFGLQWAPALLATVVIHTQLINPVGLAWWQVAVLAAVTAASYTAGAAVLIRWRKIDIRLLTLRDVVWLLGVMCVVAPLPMAIAQVWLLNGAGAVTSGQLFPGVAGFWAGSATGVGMLAPVLLIVSRRWLHTADPDLSAHTTHRPAYRELAGQVFLLAVTVWIGYAQAGGSLDYSYLIYGPLIWIGLRGGFVPAAWAVLAINVGAVALNRGEVPAQGGFALQFGLMTLTLLGVLLGAAVTQRQADAAADRCAALRDPLTGLANRTLLHDRLSQALARRPYPDSAGRKEGTAGVVLFLDLDRFKSINDSLGHAAGDAVLVEVARRLPVELRASDTVARLGGDEFAILLEGSHTPDEVAATASRVLGALDPPIEVPNGTVHVGASIGSALLRAAGVDPPARTIAKTLQRADVALHQAKSQGRHRHVAFDAAMHESAVQQRQREDDLRGSVHREDITVVFQPMVAIPSRRIVGAEALARWQGSDGRPVPPQEFIATAEDAGLIIPLGLSVLRQACAAAAGWAAGDGAPSVSVNASAFELMQPDYADTVLRVLDQAGLPPHRLELEITETQWVNLSAPTTATLHRLTRAGVGLLLDDFGTGYSSFRHLAELPVTGIKIDRSFTSTTTTSARSASIVRAILCVAAELNLDVTAEGVETEAQWEFLVAEGCDRAQGFLLGHPHTTLTGPPTQGN